MWGMSWGGHKVAQHTGHDPGEQQRTPFFRLLFEGRKTHQNSVFRFFVIFSVLSAALRYIVAQRLRLNVL